MENSWLLEYESKMTLLENWYSLVHRELYLYRFSCKHECLVLHIGENQAWCAHIWQKKSPLCQVSFTLRLKQSLNMDKNAKYLQGGIFLEKYFAHHLYPWEDLNQWPSQSLAAGLSRRPRRQTNQLVLWNWVNPSLELWKCLRPAFSKQRRDV